MQLTDTDQDYVDLLFVRMRCGDPALEALARQELRHWCAGDEQRQRYVASTGLADAMLDVLPPLPLPSHEQPASFGQPRRARRYLPGLALAASIVVAAGLWIINPQLSTQRYVAAVGEQKTVTLEDGSQVVLNTASVLQFSNRLRTRDATLVEGEALFDVQHSEWRPFRVLSEQTQVRVVGTAFSVRNFGNGSRIEVVRGLVEVRPSEPDPGRLLAAGQAVDTAGGSFGSDVRPVDIASISRWREGRLTFRSALLRDVLQELQRYRQGTIGLQDARLGEQTFSGSFSIAEPDKVLSLLGSMYNLRIVNEAGGGVRLVRK